MPILTTGAHSSASGQTFGIQIPVSVHRVESRRVSREAARGLGILNHAIEYLSDQFVDEECAPSAQRGLLKAVKVLMSVNKVVYDEAQQTATESPIGLFFGRMVG